MANRGPTRSSLRSVTLLAIGLATLGCGEPSRTAQGEKGRTPSAVQESDLQVEVIEPKSLAGLSRPYTTVVLQVHGARARGVTVTLNGSVLLREGDRQRSIHPIPLLRDGGWMRIEVNEPREGGSDRHVFCLRYTCSIEPAHDNEMIALIDKIESPVGQEAAGACLRLQEMVDERCFEFVAARLRQSTAWEVRWLLAMLLGSWRAVSAVPALLDVLRDDESREVKRACVGALWRIKPLTMETFLPDLALDPADVERSLRQWLLPVVPEMMKELFPKTCEESTLFVTGR